MTVRYKTIDEYILQFPKDLQLKLNSLREYIKQCVPQAIEKISWGMPTFYYNGNLIHFAQHKNHIGLYPGPEAIEHFKDELIEYKYSKGAIQFSNDSQLPYELINKIIKFNIERN